MNALQRAIKQFVLKALLKANDQPMTDDSVRQLVRTGFNVAMTEAELGMLIKDLETSGKITGLNDDVLGLTWSLTSSGKHTAAQLQ